MTVPVRLKKIDLKYDGKNKGKNKIKKGTLVSVMIAATCHLLNSFFKRKKRLPYTT